MREFDSEQLPVFDLLLDLRANWKNQEQFEVAVCLAHSLIHHGFKLGIKPELTLNPPLESKLVQKNLMFDLPQLPFVTTDSNYPGVTLENFDQSNAGFLRMTVTPAQIIGAISRKLMPVGKCAT